MSPEEAAKKIESLEAELKQARGEVAKYRADMKALMDELFPFEPITEEEIEKLMTDTGGRPILEIIDELEREAS